MPHPRRYHEGRSFAHQGKHPRFQGSVHEEARVAAELLDLGVQRCNGASEPCRLTNDFLPSFWLNSQSSCVLTSSDFLPHAVVGMIPTETVAKRLQTLPTQNAVTGPVPDLLSTNTSII
jgi:hypothetical protein